MATKINFNGEIHDQLSISVLDHGFLFGDSVYVVVCTFNNKPCFLDKHLDRLFASAKAISLNIPHDNKWFRKQLEVTLGAADNEESYIRIIVTRGVGEIYIDPSTSHSPNIIIIVMEIKEYPEPYYE